MTSHELAETIEGLIFTAGDDEDTGIKSVTSFKEFGMLSDNAGLVIQTDDGKEFQITIINR